MALLFSLYLALQSSVVQTYLTRKITERLSAYFQADISVKGVNIAFFNKIILEEVLIKDQQKDSMLRIGELVAQIDSFSIRKQRISLHKLSLNDTKIEISLDSAKVPNYQFLLEKTQKTPGDTLSKWNVKCSNFVFENASFLYKDDFAERPVDFQLHDIALHLSGLRMSSDSTFFMIEKLVLSDHKKFSLNNFKSEFFMHSDQLGFKNLYARLPHSIIENANITIDQSSARETGDIRKTKLDVQLDSALISMLDIAPLVPDLQGMDASVKLSGHIYGSINDLKGKNIYLSYGLDTRINCDFYLNGLPAWENTFMHIDLKQSTMSFNDLQQVHLPNTSKKAYLSFPDALYQAGVVQYQGNFTGFPGDFVAYGTINSDFGKINTDLAFKPSESNKVDIDGHVQTIDFKIGRLIKNNLIGKVSYKGSIRGAIDKNQQLLTSHIDGEIKSIDINRYEYKNIDLNGDISGRRFDGYLSINDENVNLDFNGAFDFNQQVPVFDFKLNLNQAKLQALNLIENDSVAALSGLMKANFTGNNIDNLAGSIWIENGWYRNHNGQLDINNFELKTYHDKQEHLSLRSDFIDADIEGDYQFYRLKNTLSKVIKHYFPAIPIEYEDQPETNVFSFSGKMKDFSQISKVFFPGLLIEPAYFSGQINSETNKLDFAIGSSRIAYHETILKDVHIGINADKDFRMKNRFGQLLLPGNYSLHNLALNLSGTNNRIESLLSWSNYHELTYSGAIKTISQLSFDKKKRGLILNTELLPSNIYIADSLWSIQSAKLTIDSTQIDIQHFSIKNKNQHVTVNGTVSHEKDKRLLIGFENINLRLLNDLVQNNLNIQGIMHGEFALYDPLHRAYFLSDLHIDGLRLRNHLFGDVSMVNTWNGEAEQIISEVNFDRNGNKTLHAKGSYGPQSKLLDYTIELNNLSVTALQPFMEGSFTDFRGEATGKVRLHGPISHLLFDGELLGKNAGLTLTYLQVPYTFTDKVRFAGDSLIFDRLQVSDPEGNTAIFDGTIKHENFSNMVYNLRFSSPRILAINTNSRDNEQFYGKLYANGNLSITGKGLYVSIDATGSTQQGTELNILLDYEEKAQEYDFLKFVDRSYIPEQKSEEVLPEQSSNVQMNFDVEVTPEARMQLIYNSKIGDIIRSYGYGNLQIGVDNDYNIVMYGDYNVTRGDYLFTLQNVINKKFEIERGGQIIWNGDPYDANINLNAVYHLKASLKELFPSSDGAIDYSQRVPVNCKISLLDQLSSPKIGFDIDFPSSEDRIKDEVQQFFNTEEDRNKQILSLLILGRFYTPEYIRGNYEASNTNVVGSTASELFSNQLSNWLSQISKDFDIGVNYRPGDQVTDDEVELALSTQIFNDRITLNGNIGNNSSTTNASNNSNIVGDFDLNVKISKNGKLQFKAFNHSNNNLIYETSPYTQGIGVSYREDYDTFHELWNKFKSLFGLEKSKQTSGKTQKSK